MYKTLGPLGIGGILLLVLGIALVAYADLVVAAGLAAVLAGLGLIVRAMITSMLRAWGMA